VPAPDSPAFTEAELADIEKWAHEDQRGNLGQQANARRVLRMVEELRRFGKRPVGWGRDPLSGFLEDARYNVWATAAKLPMEWRLLTDLDAALARVTTRKVASGGELLPGLLLSFGHNAFRGAAHLAAAGQLSPAYMVMRGSLEHALYAVFMSGDLPRQERWINRENSAEARRVVQVEFRPSVMLKHLARVNPGLAAQAQEHYNMTIDLGAHPNELGFTTVVGFEEDEHDLRYQARHLAPGGVQHKLCLRMTERTGQILLQTIEMLFPVEQEGS